MANKFYNHTITDFYGHPVLDNPDKFGLEIEMEGLPEGGLVFPPVAGWAVHNDGSLRNGIEFVSAGPRTVEQLTGDIATLAQTFRGLDFTPVFSYRTSLHVHANCRDLTWIQIANLWAIYTIFEIPLMEMGGEERIGNVHCQSTADCHEVVERFKQCFDDKPVKSKVYGDQAFDFNRHIGRLTNRDRRYASFNFASLPNFGTVEFRSHRGTMDAATVIGWVQTILAMKNAARVYPDPQWVVQDFSSKGPQGFAEHIFGPDHFVTQNADKFSQDAWEGLRLAQEVAFVRPAWDKATKPAKKVKPREEVVDQVGEGVDGRPLDYPDMPQNIRNAVNDNITLNNFIEGNNRRGVPIPDWVQPDIDRNTAAIANWRAQRPPQPAEARQRRGRQAAVNNILGEIGRVQMAAHANNVGIQPGRVFNPWAEWPRPAEPGARVNGFGEIILDDVGDEI